MKASNSIYNPGIMFPANNRENPFEPLYKKPSFSADDQNPYIIISKQDDPSPLFYNFPSPFFDEHDLPLNQILSHQNQLMPGNHYLVSDQIENSNTESTKKEKNTKESVDDQPIISNGPSKRRNLGTISRPANGKKDRHSKICTAQGIRDRRMRLSLQIARKFFDLQDLLGYDKASKTIEWLFSKSKKAIKELANKELQQGNINYISTVDAKSESFLSECEVVSGIEENYSKHERKSKKNYRKSQKTGCKPNTRELRDKARARARSRTQEKMILKNLENSSLWCKESPNYVQKLGLSSNSPFEGVDQESSSQNQEIRVSSFGNTNDNALLENQLDDVAIIEKFLGISRSDYHCSDAADSSNCMDQNSNLMEFLGNRDLLNNEKLNTSQYAITNQVSMAGMNDLNSVYLGMSNLPSFHH